MRKEKCKTNFLLTILFAGIIGLLSIPVQSQAAIVTFDLNFEFSGATPPAGTAPWLTATIDDQGTAGSVLLTMDATGLTGAENVDEWYFNVNPESLLSLTITFQSGVAASSVTQGVDCCKADGDGLYDIMFDFPAGNLGNRFGPAGADTESVYTLTDGGANVLTANSFNVLSSPDGGGHGPFLTAAHVQGIGPSASDSGWVAAVPVPNAALLFGTGLIGLIGVARRKRSSQNK